MKAATPAATPARGDGAWRALARFFLQRQRRTLVWGLVLGVLTVLLGIGLLGLAGWFIAATALAGLQVATALMFDVFMPSAGIRLLALGRTFSRYGERLFTHDGTLGALALLRERLWRSWAQPEGARRLQRRPARLLFRITADIDALESPYLRALLPAAATLGAAVLAGVVVGWQSPLAGLALFAWLLLAGWGTAAWLARRAPRPAAQRAMALEALRARAADLVAGQTELALAGRLQAQCAALAAADKRMAAADDRLNRLEVRGAWLQGAAATLALGAVLAGAAGLVEAGHISVPVAALLLLATLAAAEPVAALRRGAMEAGRAALALRRVQPALQPPPELPHTDRPALTAASAANLGPLVFAYPGTGRPVLQLPALSLAVGERVALVGASGSGKSTLLALLAGELSTGDSAVQAQPAAWLTQRVDLFQDTLRDNLRLAAPEADDPALWAALQAAGLEAEVRALRSGLDTRLGEGGLGLSGGQARRLALARLLLSQRPLWLLDEPTEALDEATAQDVLARLAQQAAGRSVLIATHLRREAALADRLLALSQGRLVQEARRGSAGFDALLASLRSD